MCVHVLTAPDAEPNYSDHSNDKIMVMMIKLYVIIDHHTNINS